MNISRRHAVGLGAVGLAAAATAARAATLSSPPVYRDIIYGNSNAKLTVVEYASLTCHFCAEFHNTSFPKLEADYIDTGKISFIYRDYPTDNLSAVGAVIARCTPGDGAKAMIAAAFKNQSTWATSPAPFDYLVGYAGAAGLDPGGIEACLKNQNILTAVTNVRDEALTVYKLRVTPSFVVGSTLVEGSSFENLKAAIDQALAKLPK